MGFDLRNSLENGWVPCAKGFWPGTRPSCQVNRQRTEKDGGPLEAASQVAPVMRVAPASKRGLNSTNMSSLILAAICSAS